MSNCDKHGKLKIKWWGCSCYDPCPICSRDSQLTAQAEEIADLKVIEGYYKQMLRHMEESDDKDPSQILADCPYTTCEGKILKAKVKEQEWISVEDGLPEKDQSVWITDGNFYRTVKWPVFPSTYETLTHWKPITPPTESESE
ncbi:MAG: hypothetical protein KAS32_04600 [Candidatus Peribacteraceae bacterium]|nr:hypothetical protein [Candidatus Peribacteraceae bacterium]